MHCLKSASYKADVDCRAGCGGTKSAKENLSKEEKQKNVCK